MKVHQRQAWETSHIVSSFSSTYSLHKKSWREFKKNSWFNSQPTPHRSRKLFFILLFLINKHIRARKPMLLYKQIFSMATNLSLKVKKILHVGVLILFHHLSIRVLMKNNQVDTDCLRIALKEIKSIIY